MWTSDISQACQVGYHIFDKFKAVFISGEDARFRLGFIFGLHLSVPFLLIKILLRKQH